MSDKSKLPEQLAFPFLSEEALMHSAQVFSLQEHRQVRDLNSSKDVVVPKDKEKKILDRVLERAERLSWYK